VLLQQLPLGFPYPSYPSGSRSKFPLIQAAESPESVRIRQNQQANPVASVGIRGNP
jgi:hypothetical protein